MRRESAIFWAALEFPELVSGRDWRCDKVKPDEVERNCHSLDNRIQMEISNAVLQALVKIAWSPLATALAGAVGGGLKRIWRLVGASVRPYKNSRDEENWNSKLRCAHC